MSGGYFTRTYPLWRMMRTPDGGGGWTLEWKKQADVPGRAYKTRVTDTVMGAALAGKITYTFACGADTDIEIGDQVRFDGRTLDVRAVGVTSSGQRLEALCQEVQK